MRTRWAAALAVVFVLSGCGSEARSGWTAGGGAEVDDTAVASFSAHFTGPVYDDPSDVLSPFGSDEGADLLAEWAERRDELSATSTVADVLGESPSHQLVPGTVDDAIAVRSAGFVLLRLTGHIDEPGRRATLEAIGTLVETFGPEPVLLRQRDDLRSWRG